MLPNVDLYFEDFEIGVGLQTEGRTLTETDIVNFAGVSGDFFPLHMDKEYAQATRFGQRIAHGLCVKSIASGNIVRTGIFRNLVAFYGIDSWRFLGPAFLGDTIYAVLRVASKEPAKNKDVGIVDFLVEVVNQRRETLQGGRWRILVAKRPQETAP